MRESEIRLTFVTAETRAEPARPAKARHRDSGVPDRGRMYGRMYGRADAEFRTAVREFGLPDRPVPARPVPARPAHVTAPPPATA